MQKKLAVVVDFLTQVPTKLRISLGLYIVVIVIQGGGGFVAGSLGLLTDALHSVSDFVAVSLAAYALVIAQREPTARFTYGFQRVKVLVGFVNSISLMAFLVVAVWSAIFRLHAPPVVKGELVAYAAGISAVLVGTILVALNRDILKEAGKTMVGQMRNHAGRAIHHFVGKILTRGPEDATLLSAYLHVKGDLVLTVGVALVGLLIARTHLFILDPLTSLALAAWIMRDTWKLFRESCMVLLEAAPTNMDRDAIGVAIAGVRGVSSVHDVHVWLVGSDQLMYTCHVVLDRDQLVSEADKVRQEIEELLKHRFGITHATIQIAH